VLVLTHQAIVTGTAVADYTRSELAGHNLALLTELRAALRRSLLHGPLRARAERKADPERKQERNRKRRSHEIGSIAYDTQGSPAMRLVLPVVLIDHQSRAPRPSFVRELAGA
jgi:hypothetical protein